MVGEFLSIIGFLFIVLPPGAFCSVIKTQPGLCTKEFVDPFGLSE